MEGSAKLCQYLIDLALHHRAFWRQSSATRSPPGHSRCPRRCTLLRGLRQSRSAATSSIIGPPLGVKRLKQGYDENFYKSSVFVPPESLSDLGERLTNLGYSGRDIAGIWGGNFLRIARMCWKS